MTQDEIIRMAREAGLQHVCDIDYPVVGMAVEKFAALVAEATKEKAANVCESVAWEGFHDGLDCAAAIRSIK
jgi:hypothetical protein